MRIDHRGWGPNRIAFNLLGATGGLAYTLRAEPDSGAVCAIELAEYEPDGAVVDVVALAPMAAQALANVLEMPNASDLALANPETGTLTIERTYEGLITVTDTETGRSVDIAEIPEERRALAHALRRTAHGVQHFQNARVAEAA